MRILVARNWFTYGDKPVENYATSIVRVLREKGHEVVDVPKNNSQNYRGIDLALDIDCGRNEKGELLWLAEKHKLPIPCAVMFIDTHGYPELHSKLSTQYSHVFFAVWDKRDRFKGHPSAHWCPNFTDKHWFDGEKYPKAPGGHYGFDFGFFGSKGGLERADALIKIANDKRWTHDVREIGRQYKHRWPSTQDAMANCRNLFNHQQKHDGPNLRVMESMLMKRPLLDGTDPRSGMNKLFVPWKHYIPYEAYTYVGLEEAMTWVMTHPKEAALVAEEAYIEVKTNHLAENRVNQIIEVVSNS